MSKIQNIDNVNWLSQSDSYDDVYHSEIKFMIIYVIFFFKFDTQNQRRFCL